jgi:hypothetical protein
MPTAFCELRDALRERLLRAGVAPRHVRRYLAELAEHLTDLSEEEERSGRSRAEVESVALARLGEFEELAKAMTEQRHFQSWCSLLPWATFVLGPILLLAVAYLVACFVLWSGWQFFLPNTSTPFVPIYGVAIFYFGFGRLLYYSAPILIGWGIGLITSRQRLKMVWPVIGWCLLALVGGLADVHASRTAVPGAVGDISMSFVLGPSVHGILFNMLHALTILSITVLPYLIWRASRSLLRA